MPKETKNTSNKKSCPINEKLCKCCDTLKNHPDKKKAIIALSVIIIIIALLAAIFYCKENVKYHINSQTIVKEVIDGNKSEYFFCKRGFPKDEIKENVYYITCDKQLLEI